MHSQSGYTTAALGFIVFAVIASIIIVQRIIVSDSSQNNATEESASPSASAIASSTTQAKKISASPTAQASAKNASSTPSPTVSTTSSQVSADIIVEANCADDHDGLGKHLDAFVTFKNLDKLDSKDIIISVIDMKTQSRSESHIAPDLINNITIPVHKYAYAIKGSTVPLEVVPDGREYAVRISKASYKPDGTIDVYSQALEKRFSKVCI